MRKKDQYSLAIAAIFVVIVGAYVMNNQESQGGMAYRIGDGICNYGEPTTSPDCQPGGGAIPQQPYQGEQIVCYTPDNIKHQVYVDDALDEEGPTYLAGTVKLYLDQGGGFVETDTATSSTSAATSINVPCDASAMEGFMTATDDDHSGTDFYTAQKFLDPFSNRDGILYGPATVPFHIPVLVQGALELTCYDGTGLQSDNNITIASGGSSNDLYFKISESTDDAAAQGVVIMFEFNKTAIDITKLEISGITSGVGFVKTACPTSFDNTTASWDACYRATYNGVALQLDRDTRNEYPDEVYGKISVYAQSGINPTNEEFQARVIDSMPYQEPGTTFGWAGNCGPLHETGLCWPQENYQNSNLGLQEAAEAHTYWVIN